MPRDNDFTEQAQQVEPIGAPKLFVDDAARVSKPVKKADNILSRFLTILVQVGA